MSLNSLIDRLSRDLKPVRRQSVWRDIAIIAVICIAEIIVFFVLGAALPDMPMRMHQPTFWWRLVSLGLIAVISGIPAILSFTPTYSPRRALRWLLVVIGVCLAAGLCIGAGPDDLESLARRIDWTNGIQCAAKMIALSVPPGPWARCADAPRCCDRREQNSLVGRYCRGGVGSVCVRVCLPVQRSTLHRRLVHWRLRHCRSGLTSNTAPPVSLVGACYHDVFDVLREAREWACTQAVLRGSVSEWPGRPRRKGTAHAS